MWVNKNTTRVYNKPKPVTIDGIQHPKEIFTKWSEDELNAVGLYTVVATGEHDRRYYKSTKVEDMVATPPTIGFTKEDLPVAEVKAKLVKSIEDTATKKFEEATSGYTASEMSSWAEMEAQAREHITTPLTSGMLYNEAIIAGISVDALADKVLTNANALKTAKSYIAGTRAKKIVEVMALLTVADCVLYEATPYDYTITQEDVDSSIEGTAVLGDIVTRYRNNCTEW